MRRSRSHNCYSSQDSKWLWCLFGSLHRACLLCEGWRACWIKSTSRWDECITGEPRSCLNGCLINLIPHGSNTWICATGGYSVSLFTRRGTYYPFTIERGLSVSHFRLHNVAGLSWEHVFPFCHGDLKGWFIQILSLCLSDVCLHPNTMEAN